MRKGVDIGGTFVKVFWEDGRKEKHYIKDISKDREVFLERIKDIVHEGYPQSVGIAVAGFTSLKGIVYKSPNIPALDGVDLRSLFEGIDVRVINDVSAGALGEWFYDHRDSKVLLFIAVGTGLGSGLVIEGRPFLGACGSSLELGHHIIKVGGERCSCGRFGCWEAYCSSYGLERLYEKILGEKRRDFEILQRAKEGEDKALRAVEEFKGYLLLGLMNAVHILNPDRLVLGGGLIDAMKDLFEGLERELKDLCENLPGSCFRLSFSSCAEYCMARGALVFSLLDDI
ncbi:MAG: ROK family protein [Aquificaceae bacterium]